MTFSTLHSLRYRSILDMNTLIEVVRFIITNVILAFIFLFLTLEEIDWALFSSRAGIDDTVIDKTSWNIKKLF
mgnify:CR=1 FL=1